MKKLKNITVVYNLPQTDNEDDLDTQKSAYEVVETLKKAQYDARVLGVDKKEIRKLSNLETDLVFNLIEWAGKDIEYGIRAAEELEKNKIPFTGSDSWGYKVGSDKILMKKLLEKFDISTPRYQIFKTGYEKVKPFPYPVIVKPAYEHCGIGVSQASVVRSEIEMRDRVRELRYLYQQPVLVEEYIKGRELQVTVLERGGKPWVLPSAEIIYEKRSNYWPILSYEAKWIKNAEEYKWSRIRTARLDKGLEIEIERAAQTCYEKLGGRDYPRLDVRVRGEEIFVLEMNNNPGIDFDPDSGIAISAKAAGLTTFEKLLTNIVENAYKRFT